MALFDWIENKLIDVMLKVEVEDECQIEVSDDEQIELEKLIRGIVDIIEHSRHFTYPSPDDKIEEIQLERAFGDPK